MMGFSTPCKYGSRGAAWLSNSCVRRRAAALVASPEIEPELVTVLAHDLRNGLTPVRYAVDLLERRAEREGREADLRDIARASRAVTRLSGLVADILDAARIDQGVLPIELQPVDVVAIARECALLLATSEHAVRVQASGPVVVNADPERPGQAAG